MWYYYKMHDWWYFTELLRTRNPQTLLRAILEDQILSLEETGKIYHIFNLLHNIPNGTILKLYNYFEVYYMSKSAINVLDNILCPIVLSSQVFIIRSIPEHFNLTSFITSLQIFTYLWTGRESFALPLVIKFFHF